MVVTPGEVLEGATAAGEGAHVWGGKVIASVTGRLELDESGVARVVHRKPPPALPAVGDIVTCRVTRINPRMATVDILCVGNVALRDKCVGLIRREDVRPIGLEPVDVYRSYRPGDIVLAKVLSLGDARAYYLGSSEPELGVAIARSAEGVRMRPVSWCEVECPVTGVRERRKVAKPSGAPVKAPAAAPAAAAEEVAEASPAAVAPPAAKRRKKG